MEKLKILNGLCALGHIFILSIHYYVIFGLKNFEFKNSSKISIQIIQHLILIVFPIFFVSNGINSAKFLSSQFKSHKPFHFVTLKFYFKKISSIIPIIYIYYLILQIINNNVFKNDEISLYLSENNFSKLIFGIDNFGKKVKFQFSIFKSKRIFKIENIEKF